MTFLFLNDTFVSFTLLTNFFPFKYYNGDIFFSEKGLDHVAEKILGYLDAKSLREAELVCKEWHRVIADGLLWKKLIERKVRTDPLWRGLSERKGW